MFNTLSIFQQYFPSSYCTQCDVLTPVSRSSPWKEEGNSQLDLFSPYFLSDQSKVRTHWKFVRSYLLVATAVISYLYTKYILKRQKRQHL